jgi:Ca2+-transporting ATPase
LLETVNLRMQEAGLTGESQAVEKHVAALTAADLPLAEQHNMLFMGTVAAYGRGVAAVVATGTHTQLGQIAEMIQQTQSGPTPLQRRLDQVGRRLSLVALALVGLIFLLGLLRGESFRLMFLTSISIAVAAVPEGLPAMVTIALTLGAQRMLKRRALIRKLTAVETLGSVTVICSDKTGTLTENRMTVIVLDMAEHRMELNEDSSRIPPVVYPNDERLAELSQQPSLTLLLAGAALCNDALLEEDGKEAGASHVVGDPTESALLVAAARLGLQKSELEQVFPRVAELPFDSERKRMTTIHQFPASSSQIPVRLHPVWNWSEWLGRLSYVAFTKGAVDGLVSACNRVWINGQGEPLDAMWSERILAAQDRLAKMGMRVLGVACRSLESTSLDEVDNPVERDLIFLGLAGMIDPARAEVKGAVQTCKMAGIRPVMITGDHPVTARHIASQLGIDTNGRILTGQELARLSVAQLEERVEHVSVYARVSPEHKLNIVQALQNRGHIVAMTGDGVNDAPALKKADIGVAMGVTGTDVAKEAADMVLLDDNFATIVAAVEEGRVLYDNIRKFIEYLMTANAGELWVMLLAPLLGMPLPLLPLQILWMNLVTDGLPGLALSAEPPERDTMSRPPYPSGENIFSRGLGLNIIRNGLLLGLLSLVLGHWYWRNDQTHWQTMLFTTLTLSQMALALALRSRHESLFRIGLWSNKPLIGAVVLTFGLQLLVVYVPVLQGIFKTVSLSVGDLSLCLMVSSLSFWGVELGKWFIRRRTT